MPISNQIFLACSLTMGSIPKKTKREFMMEFSMKGEGGWNTSLTNRGIRALNDRKTTIFAIFFSSSNFGIF